MSLLVSNYADLVETFLAFIINANKLGTGTSYYSC